MGNEIQNVGEAAEPGALLVVRTQDIPRCVFGVRRLEHHIPGAGILEPLAARGEIHRAELPLAERIVDLRLEAAFPFLVAHFQSDFDKLNAAVHFVFLVGDIT